MALTDKKKSRNGYHSIEAFDPRDQGIWDLLIDAKKIDIAAKLGKEYTATLAYLVPAAIKNPCAIFKGIREDGDDGLCYASRPVASFPAGRKEKPYQNQVFLVFVNPDRVIYNWRWEPCERGNLSFPQDHKTRFEARLFP